MVTACSFSSLCVSGDMMSPHPTSFSYTLLSANETSL